MTRWTKYLSKSGTLRVVIVDAGDIVDEMAKRHSLGDDLKIGLGQASLAGLLLAASHKSGERVNLSIQSSGIWKKAVVDADPEGFVRGFLIGGEEDITIGQGRWGVGTITVLQTKNSEGKQPYSGIVSLHTGFLDRDMSLYWGQSAQIQTNMAFSEDGKRAIMVQAVTGAITEDHELIATCGPELRKFVEKEVLKEAATLPEILPGHTFNIMEDTPLAFRCNCSQERVEQALLLTGKDDIKYLISQDEAFEMKCDFCNNRYQVSRKRAEELMKKLPS
jgi:molecular chaperone Hsp33